ncbi:MAG: molybdopterin-dependent oxidoreductase [Oscillospiraceae bacterium]|nr:molybdopterin-dependent oxidoreductase [Oscillospiraceae bacterium]
MKPVSELRVVNQPIRKKDYHALVTGQPVYTEDLAPRDCLVVKLLRSPHASALVKEIDVTRAKKVPGVACVLTWRDVPQLRYTQAGQSYPEGSPYDRYILDRRLRYVGDPVAIVAAESADAAERAIRLIKVTYEVQEPVLDFRTALDHPNIVHPEEDWKILYEQGSQVERNLICHEESADGDVEAVLADCDAVVEQTYHTVSDNQAMMETFRAYSYLDAYGRLNIVPSTQIAFHVRRIIANALGIPKSKVRVIRPRIGGGFGAKQTVEAEPYPAIVTWLTGRPAMIVYDREETTTCGCPRHEMEISIRICANRDGHIRAIHMHTLSNGGAYGEHSTTTVGLSGHKAISLYGALEAYRFDADVVYTNLQPAGAFRGFGATQGIFALESAVDELAHRLSLDPAWIRERNQVRQGQVMPSYFGEVNTSCTLDRCLERVKEMIGWGEKYPRRTLPNGHIRAVGLAMAMQGSAISGIDVGGATLKLGDEGFVNLLIGAADMGTGCDTTLAQIAAEALELDVDKVVTAQVDTDSSPYDSGSYASSTAFLSGGAVYRCALELIEKIKTEACHQKGWRPEDVEYHDALVEHLPTGQTLTLSELAYVAECGGGDVPSCTAHYTCPNSPPPFMAGAAEIDLDPETGKVTVVEYDAVVDCGTPLNPNLARVQTEGGLVQGIGMALTENARYLPSGALIERNLLQYKIPTRLDIGEIHVEFAPSYEEQGPYGAKSIGEIVIDTPCPAIANAVENACGVRIRELPITAEKVWRGMHPELV